VLELASRLLFAAACVSAAFTIGFSFFVVWAASRFWRPPGPRPEPPGGGTLPAVTILKPINGVDIGLYANLASFLSQDYPCLQVVFCLHDPRDPAMPILRRLQAQFPGADVEIVVSRGRIGFNPKINNLSNAAGLIKHELLQFAAWLAGFRSREVIWRGQSYRIGADGLLVPSDELGAVPALV